MTIEELLLENKKLYNEELVHILNEMLNDIDSNNIDLVKKSNIALALSKGYTVYRVKEFSEILNISKTAVKYLVNKMLAEGKIKVIKIYDYTFIKLL